MKHLTSLIALLDDQAYEQPENNNPTGSCIDRVLGLAEHATIRFTGCSSIGTFDKRGALF